jgi:hypothetical protein
MSMSPFEKMQQEAREQNERNAEITRRARASCYAVLKINSRRYAIIEEASINLVEPPVRFMRIKEGDDKHSWESAQSRLRELSGGA